MQSEYRMEYGMTREQRWVWAERMEQYRTVKGITGKKYRVRLTAEEIEGRRKLGMAAALGILTPGCMAILAWAAGIFG